MLIFASEFPEHPVRKISQNDFNFLDEISSSAQSATRDAQKRTGEAEKVKGNN